MIGYPALSRRHTRKRLMNALMLVALAGYALMLIPGLVFGASRSGGVDLKFVLITLGYMLSNLGQYGFYLIMMISIMNTVEYNELEHGSRDEGIIGSLRPFLTKMASALTVAIANITYIAFNIIRYTNSIASLEQEANEGLITAEQKGAEIDALLQGVARGQSVGLLLVMTVLPCALMFASFVLYKRRYKLDEGEYERICRELAAREAAKA